MQSRGGVKEQKITIERKLLVETKKDNILFENKVRGK